MGKEIPKINLQLFAENTGSESENVAGQEETPGVEESKNQEQENKNKEVKTFSQDVVNKMISDRLNKEKIKWETDYQTKLEQAKTEAEKLAKMNADQKAEYERKKQQEELAKREGEITRRELRAMAFETLAEKSLPKQLADILVYTDAESTNKSIESVEKVFREAVEAGVNERLKGDPPKGGGTKSKDAAFAEIEKIFQQR